MRRYQATSPTADTFIAQAVAKGLQQEPLTVVAVAANDDELSRKRGTVEERTFMLSSITIDFATEEHPLLTAQDEASGDWVAIEIGAEVTIEVASS